MIAQLRPAPAPATAPAPALRFVPRFAPLLVIAAAWASAGAQGKDQEVFTFRDPAKNLTIVAGRGRFEQAEAESNVLRLEGKVSIASSSQGLSLEADHVRCVTKVRAGRQEISSATATGAVHLVKKVSAADHANSNAKQTTDIRGERAQLDIEPKGNIVHLSGPVRIATLSAAQKQTMLVTGSSAIVSLEPSGRSSAAAGMRHATIEGPVRVTMNAQDVKSGDAERAADKSHIVATGDRMEINNTGHNPVVVMIGNVEIRGEGARGMGSITGVHRATLRLNASDEVLSWEVGS